MSDLSALLYSDFLSRELYIDFMEELLDRIRRSDIPADEEFSFNFSSLNFDFENRQVSVIDDLDLYDRPDCTVDLNKFISDLELEINRRKELKSIKGTK